MIYKNLKTNDGSIMRVSAIAMGSTMAMEALSTSEKHALYDCYRENGGNCIDTARAYSGGRSESMVAEYLNSRKCRHEIILSTKGGHPTDANPQKSRLTRAEILSDLETSLLTLGTDYVDIYWIHKDDPDVPIEDIVETCADIIRSGKARIIGASNYTTERMAAAREYALAHDLPPFLGSQIQWSLAAGDDEYMYETYGSRSMTPDRYDFYLKNEMFVFAFSSQAQGFFARAMKQGAQNLSEDMKAQYLSNDNLLRLARVKDYAKSHNCSISAPGLAYLINNRLTCIPIIGADNTRMLKESLESVSLAMTAEEADALYKV
ncbi:MAG: aldo/keto reductase [Lachnospiraceae bacterium]|nr:aldo/keto reductase [Lachnospiraceae bacterium]